MNVLLAILFLEINANVTFNFNFYFSFVLNFSLLFHDQQIGIDCNFPCSNCDEEGSNCLSCIESFSLNDTTCISNRECLLSGYIENGTCFGSLPFSSSFRSFSLFFTKTKIKKIGCHSNCSTCFGPTSENCLSCSEPKYLMGEMCLDTCPSSHYPADITRSCESKNFNKLNENKLNKRLIITNN